MLSYRTFTWAATRTRGARAGSLVDKMLGVVTEKLWEPRAPTMGEGIAPWFLLSFASGMDRDLALYGA
jgi:hypothetical protein